METLPMPELDMNEIASKAKEFAMKGALETIKEFYTGYNSPYRKAIEEELKKKQISWPFDLPDIMGLINDSLIHEINTVANTAVAKTFVPIVKEFLVREPAEILFSDFLKKFIEYTGFEHDDDLQRDDYTVSVEKNERHGWLNIHISSGEKSYEFTFHESNSNKKEGEKQKYQLLSLGHSTRDEYKQSFKLKIGDNATLELPYTREVLSDKVISYVARLVIGNTKITIDCRDFDDDMFPDRCHC